MRNQRGFTLVEILASITIFSIIVVFILQLTGQINLFDQSQERKEEAVRLANDVLNETLEEISSADRLPSIGTFHQSRTIENFTINIYDTDVNDSGNLPNAPVSLTSVVHLKDDQGVLVPRLIVVTVRWGE